jgi:hypothetical protein
MCKPKCPNGEPHHFIVETYTRNSKYHGVCSKCGEQGDWPELFHGNYYPGYAGQPIEVLGEGCRRYAQLGCAI